MAVEPVGRVEARVFTPPLRDVGDPRWSLGHKFVAFCDVILRRPLDPWQRWCAIHMFELNEDGSFRFRTIILLVARQNGKTLFVQSLIVWLLFTGRIHLAVGTAQSLDIARRTWLEACDLSLSTPQLKALIKDGEPRRANGQESLATTAGREYIVKATTADAARGIPGCDFLHLDELRTHHDFDAYSALTKTQMARPNAICLATSNAGDDQSVVLNTLHAAALGAVGGDVGLFEYSAPDGCMLDDVDGWMYANPSVGCGRLGIPAIRNALALDPAAVFRTEVMCQRVLQLDGAVDALSWRNGADPGGSIRAVEGASRLACVDVSSDGQHVTLACAVRLSTGRYRVEIVAAWQSLDDARYGLGVACAAGGFSALGWYPAGPGAAMGHEVREAAKASTIGVFPKPGEALEIQGAGVMEACQAFAALVASREIVHSDDPLLNAQIGATRRLNVGDGWRFARRDAGHCDSSYAAAGAVMLARRYADADYRIEDSYA